MTNDKSEATYYEHQKSEAVPDVPFVASEQRFDPNRPGTPGYAYMRDAFGDYGVPQPCPVRPEARMAGSTSSIYPHGPRLYVRLVLVMLALGGLIVAALLFSGRAGADPSIAGVDLEGGEESYLVDIDAFAINPDQLPDDMTLLQLGYAACISVSQNPDFDGVAGTAEAIASEISTGTSNLSFMQDNFNAGVVLGRAVDYLCTRNYDLVHSWAESTEE